MTKNELFWCAVRDISFTFANGLVDKLVEIVVVREDHVSSHVEEKPFGGDVSAATKNQVRNTIGT